MNIDCGLPTLLRTFALYTDCLVSVLRTLSGVIVKLPFCKLIPHFIVCSFTVFNSQPILDPVVKWTVSLVFKQSALLYDGRAHINPYGFLVKRAVHRQLLSGSAWFIFWLLA